MRESRENNDFTATLKPKYLDDLFTIMAHRRRRYILEFLMNNEAPISVSELAEEIANKENNSTPSEDSKTGVQEVHHSLYHVHIPKLADADIVEYDQDQDVILPSTHTGLASQFFETK